MALQAKTKAKIQNGIDETKTIDAGNVHAEWFPKGHFHNNNVGRLDNDEAKKLIALSERHALFVVFSYRTPIAYVAVGYDWHVVEQHFSPTTTHHQNVVKVAIDNYGFYS